HERVQRLLAWIQGSLWSGAVEKGLTPINDPVSSASTNEVLDSLAYTLQVGREAMEEGLALQVRSLQELEEKLHRYVEGGPEGGKWYRGQVKQYKGTVALLDADEEQQEAIGKWFQRGKYEKLLQWWVKGLTIDWRQLYGEQKPGRISLPTYPFAQE